MIPATMSTAVDVPGYADLQEIGRGGYAVVYRASQLAFNRTVALKVLQRADLDDEQQRRFAKECQAVGGLSWHPHIVGVYDAGITPTGYAFLAMEFLEDGSLGDRLRREGPLAWSEALAIAIQVAGALEAAHQAGVIHRDVKPENLLVDHYGEVKLADFGIAAVSGGTQTATGVVTATISHAAPEILAGSRASVSSDIYALGSTTYSLLVGKPAFWESTDEGVIPVIMRATTLPVPDLRPRGVPDDLSAAIEVAMAKDPARRPASARELGEALQAIQRAHGLPVTDMRLRSTRPTSPPPIDPTATAVIPTRPPGPPPGPGIGKAAASSGSGPTGSMGPIIPAPGQPGTGGFSQPVPATISGAAVTPDPGWSSGGQPPSGGGGGYGGGGGGGGEPPPVGPSQPPKEPKAKKNIGPAVAMVAGAAVVLIAALLLFTLGGGDDDDGDDDDVATDTVATDTGVDTTPDTDAVGETTSTEGQETTVSTESLGDPIQGTDPQLYTGADPAQDDVQVDACGTGLCVNLSEIVYRDGRYEVTFSGVGYTPTVITQNHVHFYWNIYDSHRVTTSVPEADRDPWVAWPGTIDEATLFTGFVESGAELDFLNRPEGATAICGTPGDPSHVAISPDNYDCIDLPAAEGGSTTTTAADDVVPAGDDEVVISGFAFNPPDLAVAAGTTVTWSNHDDTNHTVSFDGIGVDSGGFGHDETFSHAFEDPGEYSYICNIHPSMTATVTVE
jgi:serine/threonine protein kinase/plastocyanin